MQKTKFAIDFLADKTFEGYTRGEGWNGFACPYFTFDQAQKVVEAWRDTNSFAFYDGSRDEFVFEMQDGGQDSFGFVEIDDKKVYPIGCSHWIWNEH